MKKLRILLLPFSGVYGLVMALRNLCYDLGIFHVYTIPVKSICVGNLSTGGTGKTPHVEYLIRHYLNKNYKIAVLSRGYGRTTKGVIEIEASLSTDATGDEPLQYKRKFGKDIVVVVAEKRKKGVEYIMEEHHEVDLIILDDAFQHRAVKAGINILITAHDDLYADDFVLPAGNLREWKTGRKRADAVIVSKCPEGIGDVAMSEIKQKLKFTKDKVWFSHLAYGEKVIIADQINTPASHVLLVTGIAHPKPLVDHLSKHYLVTHLTYPDHHVFSEKEIRVIREKFDTFANGDKIIVTTEKDYMRLKGLSPSPFEFGRWYYQPVEVKMNNENKLIELLNNYA